MYHSNHFPDLKLIEEFRKIAPTQDDLAFRWATMVRGIAVALTDFRAAGATQFEFPGVPNFDPNGANSEDLFELNLRGSGRMSPNDQAWNRLVSYCTKMEIGVDIASRLTII